jgi:cytochrome c
LIRQKIIEIVCMKKLGKFLVFLCLTSTTAFAHADEALILKSNCLACHATERKKLGPSFKEMAARYANDNTSVEKIAEKIQLGGSGAWGNGMMPPQSNLSNSDALTLAKYIQSLNQAN